MEKTTRPVVKLLRDAESSWDAGIPQPRVCGKGNFLRRLFLWIGELAGMELTIDKS